MRNNSTPPTTPLLGILRQLAAAEKAAKVPNWTYRKDFAKLAGTSAAYLYQLAGCERGACRTRLAKAVADASIAMHKKHGSDKITLETLATMCPLPGAEADGQ